jgi:hypothetical protein
MRRTVLIGLVCAVAHGYAPTPHRSIPRSRVIANSFFRGVAPIPERDAIIFTSPVGIVDPTTVSRASPEKAAEVLREWLGDWVQAWEAEGSGLTTPIEVKPTDDGARLVWKPKESSYSSSKEDRARQKGGRWEQSSTSSGSDDDEPKPKRQKKTGGLDFRVLQPEVGVEVVRCDYDEGVIVKVTSEKTIISRLKRDLAVYEKAVKNSSA